MKTLKSIIFSLLALLIIFYVAYCALLYNYQTDLLFHPIKDGINTQYKYHNNYEEVFVTTQDGNKLHTLLFKTSKPSKGLVFFLHGNAGSLFSWGKTAKLYNQIGYDVWMMDYRSFGKSEGELTNETALFSDVDLVFEKVKLSYDLNKIIVIGYSMGTGLATRLASLNKVRKLVLMAPYYGLDYLILEKVKAVPSFLMKFPIQTYKFIQKVRCPVYIFHGTNDGLIPITHSLKLKKLFKDVDQFLELPQQEHGGIQSNSEYIRLIQFILK